MLQASTGLNESLPALVSCVPYSARRSRSWPVKTAEAVLFLECRVIDLLAGVRHRGWPARINLTLMRLDLPILPGNGSYQQSWLWIKSSLTMSNQLSCTPHHICFYDLSVCLGISAPQAPQVATLTVMTGFNRLIGLMNPVHRSLHQAHSSVHQVRPNQPLPATTTTTTTRMLNTFRLMFHYGRAPPELAVVSKQSHCEFLLGVVH